MHWRTEKNRPFGGNVDSECRLNVCEELGEITFAKGEFSIPLIVDFYSGRNTKSPTMGAYWILNVADLRLVKNDVNSYHLFLPNGAVEKFRVSSKKGIFTNPNSEFVLAERPNMQVLKDERGFAYTFKNTVLEQIKSPKGDAVDFVYKERKLVAIMENGQKAALFEYGENSLEIKFVREGLNVRMAFKDVPDGKMGAMLSTIESDGKIIRSYAYDFKQPYNAKFKMSGGTDRNEYTFNLNDGKVSEEAFSKSGKEDRYSYGQQPHPLGGIQLTRTLRSNGLRDLWYEHNCVKAEQKTGGPIITTYYIGHGSAAGLARRTETIFADGKKTESLMSYDDKGRILREIRDGKIMYNMKYRDAKSTVECYTGDWKPVWKKTFNKEGRLVSYSKADGTSFDVKYIGGNKAEVTLLKNKEKVNTAIFDESLLFIR